MPRKNGNDLSVSGVASVDRALSVLTAFKRGDKALSLAELSRRTGLVKSTVMRLAISLEQIGLLKRVEDGQYRLDAEVLRLASIYQEQIDLEDLVVPVLRCLVDETKETASFYIRRGERRLCLFRVEFPHRLRLHIRPGDLLPMDEAAIAQVLRAFDDPEGSRSTGLSVPLYTVLSGLVPASITCALGRAATSRHAASRMASTVTVRRRNWSCGNRRERTGGGGSEGGESCAVHRMRDRTERLIAGI